MSAVIPEAGRLRQLEAEIKRLESENKKLLNKVHRPSQPNGNTSLPLDLDDPEDGLLDLDELLSDETLKVEEEWLYVSPRFPATPEQKKVTPREWLTQGLYDGEVLSLDEVRKSLVKDIEAAEEIDEVNYDSYHKNSRSAKAAVRRKKEASSSPRTVTKVAASGKGSSDDVPVVKWKRPVVVSDDESSGSVFEERVMKQRDNVPSTNGDIPIVKWKRPVLPAAEEESLESLKPNGGPAQDVPVVKWKRPVIPSDEESEPVVRRKAKVPGASDEPANDVPIVKWKRPVVPSDEESIPDEPVVRRTARLPLSEEVAQDVPVVKWKRPVVPSDDSLPDEPAADVPVVKWKRPVVPSDEESERVVRRKAKVPGPSDEPADDVPIVKWKRPVVPSEEDLVSDEPVVRRRARVPPSDEPADDVPVVKWKRPVVPSDNQVPVVKRTSRGSPSTRSNSKLNPPSAASSDVPVVNWKAKSPTESPSPESVESQKSNLRRNKSPLSQKARSPTESLTRKSSSPESMDLRKSNTRRNKSPLSSESVTQQKLARREGLKSPADSKRNTLSSETSDVSSRKYKAKLPANSQESQDKPLQMGVSTRKGGAKMSPQLQYNGRAAQSAPGNSTARSSSPGTGERQYTSTRRSRAGENLTTSNSPSKVAAPEILRSSRLMQHESNESLSSESVSQKSSSRRSSFSDSRSPSPPSIAPHIRKVVGSPVMRRRTPSPARAAACKSSPSQSPALQQKQQLKLLTSQALSGSHLTPGMVPAGAKLRSPHMGLAKGGTPVKGLISPGERKRRLLPASPDSGNSRLQGISRSVGLKGQAAPSPDSVSQVPPEQGEGWLDGCF